MASGSLTYTELFLLGVDKEEELAKKEMDRVLADNLDRLRRATDNSKSPQQSADNKNTQPTYTVLFAQPGQSGREVIRANILINFPMEKSALAKKMRVEIEDAYILYGISMSQSVYRFGVAGMGSGALFLSSGKPSEKAGVVGYSNGTPKTSYQEALNATRTVSRAADDALGNLKKKIETILPVIQEKAQEIAKQRLKDAAAEILEETTRYINMEQRDTTGERAKEQLNNAVEATYLILRGPRVALLLEAFRSIKERERAVQKASSDFAKFREDVLIGRDPVTAKRFAMGQMMGPTPSPLDVMAHSPQATALEQAVSELALTLMVKCRDFPILHRIWKHPDLPEDVKAQPVRGNSRDCNLIGLRRSSQAVDSFSHAIRDSLLVSWRANEAFTAKINEPDLVWSFPPLIRAALEALEYPPLSIEFRAAQERMEKAQAMRLTSVLQIIIGGLDIAAGLTAAAPPVMLGLAATSLVLTAIDSTLEYLELREKEDAFKSVLDPSKAVASEPSYVGFVVNIALSLLDVKGFRDALHTARYAKEVDIASKALDKIKALDENAFKALTQ